MSIATILIVIAGLMALIDAVLWNSGRGYSRTILTPAAVVLVCVALLVGAGSIH